MGCDPWIMNYELGGQVQSHNSQFMDHSSWITNYELWGALQSLN